MFDGECRLVEQEGEKPQLILGKTGAICLLSQHNHAAHLIHHFERVNELRLELLQLLPLLGREVIRYIGILGEQKRALVHE